MTARRLRAPATDGGLLAEPPLDDGRRSGRRQCGPAVCLGLRLPGSTGELAPNPDPTRGPRARPRIPPPSWPPTPAETLERSGRRPSSSPGISPSCFIPASGSRISRRRRSPDPVGGLALNLIVDNDIPKSASIRVPRFVGGRIGTVAVEFDEWQGEIPYEDWKVRDESMFATFARSSPGGPRGAGCGSVARRLLASRRRATRRGRHPGPPILPGPPRGRGNPGAFPTWSFPSGPSARPRVSSGSPRT